jgi:hypothetical protein
MPAQTSNLFLVQDLEDSSATRGLADSDLNALRTVASWIKNFAAMPNKDLGRSGPVCPFVGTAMDRGKLWLAPERIADRAAPELLQLVKDYELMLLAQPAEGDDATYKAIVVVFTDLSDRLEDYPDAEVTQLLKPSYAEDGVVLGEFHERTAASAIYNPNFHPFRPPVPFLLVRGAVTTDWKFFLDDEDWLNIWARRFGETAAPVLAEELRHTSWNRLES